MLLPRSHLIFVTSSTRQFVVDAQYMLCDIAINAHVQRSLRNCKPLPKMELPLWEATAAVPAIIDNTCDQYSPYSATCISRLTMSYVFFICVHVAVVLRTC